MKKLIIAMALVLVIGGCAPLFIYQYHYEYDSRPFNKIAELKANGWAVVEKEAGGLYEFTMNADGTATTRPAYYDFTLRRVIIHDHERR